MQWISRHIEVVVLALLSMLAPTTPVLLATGTLVAVDLFLGLAVAYRRGRRITSHRLSHTVHKLITYGLLICIARFLEVMTSDAVPFVKLAASSLALTEGTSVLEKLAALGGKGLTKQISALLKSSSRK